MLLIAVLIATSAKSVLLVEEMLVVGRVVRLERVQMHFPDLFDGKLTLGTHPVLHEQHKIFDTIDPTHRCPHLVVVVVDVFVAAVF